LLGRSARVVDHSAVRNVAQGAPLGSGSTFFSLVDCNIYNGTFNILFLLVV